MFPNEFHLLAIKLQMLIRVFLSFDKIDNDGVFMGTDATEIRKIAHYVFSLPVPNEKFRTVIKALEDKD